MMRLSQPPIACAALSEVFRITLPTKPSQTIGYGDSATSSGSELKVNNLISGNKVHFRHGKRGNFAYADGHVTSLPGFYTHSCGVKYGTSNPDEANNIGCVNPDEADCNTENSLFWSR